MLWVGEFELRHSLSERHQANRILGAPPRCKTSTRQQQSWVSFLQIRLCDCSSVPEGPLEKIPVVVVEVCHLPLCCEYYSVFKSTDIAVASSPLISRAHFIFCNLKPYPVNNDAPFSTWLWSAHFCSLTVNLTALNTPKKTTVWYLFLSDPLIHHTVFEVRVIAFVKISFPFKEEIASATVCNASFTPSAIPGLWGLQLLVNVIGTAMNGVSNRCLKISLPVTSGAHGSCLTRHFL